MSPGLKPYPKMKDSSVAWLGDVPAHWAIERLKSSVSNVVELSAKSKSGEFCVALEHVEGWTGRVKQPDLRMTLDSQVKRFKKGDVLFGRLRPYLAKVTRPESDGVCVGEFLVLRPHIPTTWAPYLELVLRSKPVIEAVSASTFGAKMPRADWQFIGGMPILTPPLDEQCAIVRFLDYMDHRIRRYILARQKLITLLEEQKQAIIFQAVTRGLDPDVRLKPSGVEWLGDVPEHWEVTALRNRYAQVLGKMLDSKRITGEHPCPYIRNVDVQWDQINTADLPLMDIAEDEYERYTLQLGDLVVCEGGEVGRCAIWAGELEVCGFQKALHRLRPRNQALDLVRFMYFVLRAAAGRGAFRDGHVSTILHLTGDKLRAHRFSYPPLEEQAGIVSALDFRLTRLASAVESVSSQISLLCEYRTRLIADVVTGKLDVREAAKRLPPGDLSDEEWSADMGSTVDPDSDNEMMDGETEDLEAIEC